MRLGRRLRVGHVRALEDALLRVLRRLLEEHAHVGDGHLLALPLLP